LVSQLARSIESWKNLPWAISSSKIRRASLVGLAAFAVPLSALPVPAGAAQFQADNASLEKIPSASAVQIYSTADETAQVVETLSPGEKVTPMAETQGIGGVKWYLVKTPSGISGWIRQSDDEHSKKVDNFFKALPPETASSATAPQGAIIVPVRSTGRATVVAATLNRSLNGNLMLDTGATTTVISRRLASLLSLRPVGNAAVQTVGGIIAVAVARLQSLKVAEAEVNDLTVVVHDFSRDPRVEGLLGMDFLGRYRIGLDVHRQVLVLMPR
jgi:hypothetical protein